MTNKLEWIFTAAVVAFCGYSVGYFIGHVGLLITGAIGL